MSQSENHSVMRCELITWRQFRILARRLATLVRQSGYQSDIIVAIGRGGWMPARLLSDYLDIYNLTGFKIEHYRGAEKASVARVRYPLSADVSGLKVLLVDDVSDSGDTFAVALSHLRESGQPEEIRTAVLHHKVVSAFKPDFFACEITQWCWLTYPWAVLEDVSGFIQRLRLEDAPLPELEDGLMKGYGIRPSAQMLLDAQALAQRRRDQGYGE